MQISYLKTDRKGKRLKIMKKNKEILWDLLDSIKKANTSQQRRKKSKWLESLFKEIIAEYFTNLRKVIHFQVQEGQICSIRLNLNNTTPRHMKIKLSKVKHKEDLESGKRKKQITYKGDPIRLAANFSTEI